MWVSLMPRDRSSRGGGIGSPRLSGSMPVVSPARLTVVRPHSADGLSYDQCTDMVGGEIAIPGALVGRSLSILPVAQGGWQTQARPFVAFTPVLNGRVMTEVELRLQLTDNTGQPVPGVRLDLQSNRQDRDHIYGPSSPTDSRGFATASVQTRDQPGVSTIISNTENVRTTRPAVVNWLPADYLNYFLVTCYVISSEADFLDTPLRAVPELGGRQLHDGFLRDVIRQGSGLCLDGSVIRFQKGVGYLSDTCARTATNVCAQEGKSIAVDPKIIPRPSSVSVAILGDRRAQDGGDWIMGWHIDYMGLRRAECEALGQRWSQVILTGY